MIQAYAVADVREVENAAMAQVPDGELMERASRGLAEVVGARLDDIGGSRVVALVGGGNNGGDALYAAGWLSALGLEVGAVTTSAGTVHPAAAATADDLGVTIVPGDEPGWRQLLAQADVVIDGITGIGGRAGLREEGRRWVEAIPEDAYVVAVDLPSGTDPAGEVRAGSALVADETVTFGAAKPVHLLPAGEPATGRLTVTDIGLDFTGYLPAVERLEHADVAALWPLPGAADHKYTRGVVGMVTGSPAYPGAAVLAALGALGAGTGMVRYLGPAEVAALVHQHAPEVVTAAGRVQAWVLGSGVAPAEPGSAGQVERIHEALAGDLPAVVDAGALELVARRDGPTVLTPHAGELAQLLRRLEVRPEGIAEVTRQTVTAAPLPHARAAAQALDAVVLLKGSTTLVVPPPGAGRPVRSQTDGPPWLATAGAGDVLGGVVGTLLAAGLDPLDAASLAALVHGVAAHRCNPGGPVRALRVADALAGTVASLLAGT